MSVLARTLQQLPPCSSRSTSGRRLLFAAAPIRGFSFIPSRFTNTVCWTVEHCVQPPDNARGRPTGSGPELGSASSASGSGRVRVSCGQPDSGGEWDKDEATNAEHESEPEPESERASETAGKRCEQCALTRRNSSAKTRFPVQPKRRKRTGHTQKAHRPYAESGPVHVFLQCPHPLDNPPPRPPLRANPSSPQTLGRKSSDPLRPSGHGGPEVGQERTQLPAVDVVRVRLHTFSVSLADCTAVASAC
eukprot:3336471-Rhodomonas_salina.1